MNPTGWSGVHIQCLLIHPAESRCETFDSNFTLGFERRMNLGNERWIDPTDLTSIYFENYSTGKLAEYSLGNNEALS